MAKQAFITRTTVEAGESGSLQFGLKTVQYHRDVDGNIVDRTVVASASGVAIKRAEDGDIMVPASKGLAALVTTSKAAPIVARMAERGNILRDRFGVDLGTFDATAAGLVLSGRVK